MKVFLKDLNKRALIWGSHQLCFWNIDRWIPCSNILTCQHWLHDSKWKAFWHEILHICNPKPLKLKPSDECYSLPADTEQMLLNHPIDYLHSVCVCGVWRIARGSQALHVNGTLCQQSRLLIHQALLYQTIHPHTCTHTYTHAIQQHTFATQRRQMHRIKRWSRESLNQGVLEDGVCLYQTHTLDGAWSWGLLSL